MAGTALVLGACGDDSGNGGDDSGVTDSGPDEDAGGDDAGPTTVMCSDADQMAVDEFDGMADDDFGEYSDVVASCGQGCATESDAETCTRECLDSEGAGEVASDECEGCFIGVVQCAIDNCIAECISDANSEECIACRCGDNADNINCQQEFTDCSGLPSDLCE